MKTSFSGCILNTYIEQFNLSCHIHGVMLTPENTDYSNKNPRIRYGIPHPLEMLNRVVPDSPNSAVSC